MNAGSPSNVQDMSRGNEVSENVKVEDGVKNKGRDDVDEHGLFGMPPLRNICLEEMKSLKILQCKFLQTS